MKKWLAGAFFLIVIFLSLAYYFYNKPRRDMAQEDAAFTLSASELSAAFFADEKAANEKYLGKILEVQGRVSELIEEENSFGLLLDGGEDGMVYCAFHNQPVGISVDQSVVVKGICSGYLMDVVLNDCVIKKEDL